MLSDTFLAAAGERSSAERTTLEARLTDLCSRAEALSPSLASPRSAFAEYLGTHAVAERIAQGEDLDDPSVRELVLACAARRGIPEAARVFERTYVAQLDVTLAKMHLCAATLDEVKQRVRAKLLAPSADGSFKLDEYAGRGRLAGLVQVVATREAIDLVRAAGREQLRGDDDLFDAPGGGRDPELEVVKARDRAEFKAAFEEAVRALSSRERNLLRMHLLGGMTLEQLAEMYGVHRATVVRWLAAARESVLKSTKAALRTRLRVRPDELESLLRVAESRLDLSVERLLRTMPGAADEDAAPPEDGGNG